MLDVSKLEVPIIIDGDEKVPWEEGGHAEHVEHHPHPPHLVLRGGPGPGARARRLVRAGEERRVLRPGINIVQDDDFLRSVNWLN